MVLRTFAMAVASLCFVATAAVNPALLEVKTVYLLGMSNGLDQYMANWLTRTGRFEVVTDPAKADAVFTDRLGTAFEEKWKELYPPPEPPKPEPAKEEAKKDDATTGGKPPDILDAVTAPATRISAFSKGKGNIFLVSRKTGSVIWSYYSTPRDMRSQSLDSNAQRIVDRLGNDLKPKD